MLFRLTWKDKNQVCFLSWDSIGFSDGLVVMIHTHRCAKRDEICWTMSTGGLCVLNAVDKNDSNSANYSTTICTNQYYLHIFCWCLDHVTHCMVVVCELAKQCIGLKKLKNYLTKNGSCCKFKIDLRVALLN